jgi:hypothetical protein
MKPLGNENNEKKCKKIHHQNSSNLLLSKKRFMFNLRVLMRYIIVVLNSKWKQMIEMHLRSITKWAGGSVLFSPSRTFSVLKLNADVTTNEKKSLFRSESNILHSDRDFPFTKGCGIIWVVRRDYYLGTVFLIIGSLIGIQFVRLMDLILYDKALHSSFLTIEARATA